MNKKSNRFSPEVRERAVRLVQEHRGEYPSLWACIESIAPKIGCVPQTLNDWVKQQDIDTGTRDGLSAGRFEGPAHSIFCCCACLATKTAQLGTCRPFDSACAFAC